MSEKKKIDKKTLDAEITNALTDEFDRFEHFAMTNWKLIALISVLIVVAVAVVCSVMAWRKSADLQAASALSNADSIEAINKALTQYPNHKADISARLRLVGIYFKKKDYKNVIAEYDKLAKMDIPDQLAWRLKLNRGYIYELEKDYPKAVQAFSAVGSDTFVEQAYRCEANYSAGRISAQTEKWNDAARYLGLCKNTVNPQGLSFAIEFYKGQADFLYDRLVAEGKVKKVALAVKKTVKPVAAAPVQPVAAQQ